MVLHEYTANMQDPIIVRYNAFFTPPILCFMSSKTKFNFIIVYLIGILIKILLVICTI
jgi:hypothetical protein